MSPLVPTNLGPKKSLSLMELHRLQKQQALEKSANTAKINLFYVTVFSQQLAAMLEAGLSISPAMEALEDQVEHPVFKIIIRRVREDISSGSSFSEAVKKYPNAFPPLFIFMIEAGEASGGISTLLQKVAEYLEASVTLAKKVKSAMIYPCVVISVAIAIVTFLMVKVIPQFTEMFASFGSKLPAPTLALMAVSNFIKQYFWLMALIGIGTFFGVRSYVKTPKGRIVKDKVLRRIPIVGVMLQKVSLSRFMHTYAILARSGVPILRSLEICAGVSENTFVEQACARIANTIAQGGQMSDAINNDPYIPSLVMHMAKAGEKTGNVDEMLDKAAAFYDNDVENMTGALTSLIQPMVVVFLGVVIGGIVIALFLPILNLASAAGGQG